MNDRGIDVNDAEERTRALKEFESSRRRPGTTVDQVVDHLEHAREVAGVEHIGIGSDYDGYSTFPEGLDDVSGYPTLFAGPRWISARWAGEVVAPSCRRVRAQATWA